MEPYVYLVVDGAIYDAGLETDLVNLANAEGLEDWEIKDGTEVDHSKFWLNGEVLTIESSDPEDYVEKLARLSRIFS